MKNKNRNVIIVCTSIILAVIVTIVVIGLCIPQQQEVIQGQAETADYRISSKVPARVLELRVEEGDAVTRGDTLAILEAPDIQAKLAQAEAAFKAAQALEQKARNGARQEQIQSAHEIWQKAIAAREVAEKNYNRVNRLFESGVMAEQKRDEAYANYRAMLASENAAKSQYDMAMNGSRHEDINAAQAQVLRAESAINEVSSYINETVLLASDDGIVTEIFPEVGELVGTGAPIMNIAKLNDIKFLFNVREDLLPGLEVGKQITLYIPTYNTDITAKITRIKDVGSFATWKATKALDKFDLKTFELQAYPTDASALPGMRSGMSAIIKR